MLITLDSHTKKFFEYNYHDAPAQEFIHLATEGLEGRVFGARGAVCPNGQQVIICQERSASDPATGVGPIFVLEYPIFLGSKDYLVEYAVGLKMSVHLMPNVRSQPDSEKSLSIIEGGIWRYHFDRKSGWGCRVNSLGLCYLRNLRVCLDEGESFYLPASLNWKLFASPLDTQSTCAFLKMNARTFHDKVRKAAYTPQTPLFRALSFYRKNLEEQCQQVLRRSVSERQRVEKRVGAYVALELEAGGALDGVAKWAWPMWNTCHFVLPQPDGTIEKKPVPPALLQVRDEMLATLGLSLGDQQEIPRLCDWPTEEMLRTVWLVQFTCSTEEMSSHEIALEISHR